MAVEEERTAMWHILRLLRSQGDDWTRHRRPSRAAAAAKVAEGKFTTLEEHELESRMLHRGNSGSFDENQIIYVKPPEKDPSAVAGIWCRWNYEKTPPQCGFYYGMWSAEPCFPASDPPDDVLHPAFVGYRFETPEVGDNHNYYHAQPCRSMGDKDDPVAHALPISQRHPTWPLAAENALELLLCLVTSLYGMKGLSTLLDDVLSDPVARSNALIVKAIKTVLGLQRVAS